MPEFEKEEFKFPHETEEKEAENKLEVEIEDDTPEPDRNRQPMPKEIVENLEKDELDAYEGEVKQKLMQMRKVWHDERRAKEEALREHNEAIDLARRVLADNERMKRMLSQGEKEYKEAKKDSAKAALKSAKQQYKEAYEAGDVEKLTKAQEAITNAQISLDRVKKFKLPALQEEKFAVQHQQVQQQPAQPQPDHRAQAWQQRNNWFGQDEEMTAAALGLHEKLKRNGVVVGSDEYYTTLDKTIRKRFPENFDAVEPEEPKAKTEARPKPSTVVAPATRSTSPNKIRLKASQVQLAKKLGLTPEQYALELKKLEA